MSFLFVALKPCIFLSITLPYNQIARVIVGTNVVLFVTFTVVVYASICVFTLSKKKVHYRAENTQQKIQQQKKRKKGIKFSKELNVAKSCFLVVVCSVTCCLPSVVVFSFNTAAQYSFNLVLVRRCLGVLL